MTEDLNPEDVALVTKGRAHQRENFPGGHPGKFVGAVPSLEWDAALDRILAALAAPERPCVDMTSRGDTVKMLRETLCVAQCDVGNYRAKSDRRNEHVERLGRLLDICDEHRPLGPDGTHGNLHTTTCGCDDKV